MNDLTDPNTTPSFRVSFNSNNNFDGKVPDPNETWQEFWQRIMKFRLYKPPMIEKDQVPLEKRQSVYMRMQSKLLEIEYDKKGNQFHNIPKVNLYDETEELSEKPVDIEKHINIEMKENLNSSFEVLEKKVDEKSIIKSENYCKINNEHQYLDREKNPILQMKDDIIQD